MTSHRILITMLTACAFVGSGKAHTDVVMETVSVGNPGNAGESQVDGTFGGVDYDYQMGKYEVTAGQYATFLNAVSATDIYGLYDVRMWMHLEGCKIERTGSPGNYTYSVSPDRANRPVNFVSFGDGLRFANWLHNGQPVGAQNLTAMKLYAFRALDYVHAAGATDRRYLLFCAVQKAKVSTEGVKVISQLSECVGAKGFESDTYFESALRDIQLIPGLEGSAHINLGQTVSFAAHYFTKCDPNLGDPESLTGGRATHGENPYLMAARCGATNTVTFPHYLKAYRPFMNVRNVRVFVCQAKAFRRFARRDGFRNSANSNQRVDLAWGQCLATIAYAQLIAENAHQLHVGNPMMSAIFHHLIVDLSAAGQALAALPEMKDRGRMLARRMCLIPQTTDADWSFVSDFMDGKSLIVTKDPTPLSTNALATRGSFLWRFLKRPARVLSRLLFDLKVEGVAHVPQEGGALIVSNHQSNLDPFIFGVGMNRPLNYIAKSQLFNRRFARWLLRSLNAFPVRQGTRDVGAIRESILRLQNGHLLNIYPEGARTPDGLIQPLKKGVALIIKRSGVPVIPAVILGTFEAWPIQRRFPRASPVRVRFGPPLQFDGMESDNAIMAVIDGALRQLFDEGQRDRAAESED